MLPPPGQGDPLDFIPPGTPNREAQAAVLAWEHYKTFASLVLDQALFDLYALQGVPM